MFLYLLLLRKRAVLWRRNEQGRTRMGRGSVRHLCPPPRGSERGDGPMAGGHGNTGTRSGRSKSVISTRSHRFDLAGGPSAAPRHAKVNFARGRSRPGLTSWPCAPPRQCPPERVCEGPYLPQGRKRAAPTAPPSPRAPLSRNRGNRGHPQGSRLSTAAETRPAGADPPPQAPSFSLLLPHSPGAQAVPGQGAGRRRRAPYLGHTDAHHEHPALHDGGGTRTPPSSAETPRTDSGERQLREGAGGEEPPPLTPPS